VPRIATTDRLELVRNDLTGSELLQNQAQLPRWESVLEDAEQAPTVLVVDEQDVNRRLIKGIFKATGYKILEAKRPSDALAIVAAREIDLVIVDLVMPEMSGIDFCRLLKGDRRTQLIPIVMTAASQGTDLEMAGLESGADEFLIKPLKPSIVRTRVRTMLRHKALIGSLEEAETILFALAQLVEKRDHYTGLHCQRLAAYGVAMGQALGLTKHELVALYRGGYLHDIGKIAVPDSILFKQGVLNEEEWQVMRQHTLRGEEICRPMKTLKPVLPIIRSHHERWDGEGYPDGLAGDEIPLLARILQVADIYDALTTARSYKQAFSHERAVAILAEEAKRGWRDPELVALFSEITRPGSITGDADLGPVTIQESLEAMRRELAR